MQTWKLRLISADGLKINTRQAITRYLFASLGIGLMGFGLWWAFFDREHQFLHDRLAGTRIIKCDAN
jgi:uncharacterized RDD family membrane protein YckC